MDLLHPAEIRVLGSLVEKELTTPEYYPLTLNALVNACNQKSSREPIVNYDEDTVMRALELLRQKGLAVRVSGAGHRVEKYGQTLGERLNLGRREVPLLCVMMLRGPQTVGELRARTERMHEFADLEEVEHTLNSLAVRQPDPLVRALSRGRWAQTLGEMAPDIPAEAPPASDAPSPNLAERVAVLEREVADLKQTLESFRKQFE